MNKIIVDVGVYENRLAIMENDDLVEYYIERRNNKRTVGNIYKGRVANVLPGMQAAFIDIGLEKNSFLYVKDAVPLELLNSDKQILKEITIKDLVKTGQEIIVQIIKEPIGSKGARVTTHITLPGRYLVLMPGVDYVGVSRRISSEEERSRLKEEAEAIKPNNMGIIVRTAAEGKSSDDFNDDIRFLLKLNQKIEKDKKLGYVPRIIYKDFDLINSTIRDIFNKNFDKFIINDAEEYKNAVDLLELLSPYLSSRIQLLEGEDDIFQCFNIEAQLKKNMGRKIWLKSGGYIVIDTTEALTVIDVNTGKYVGTTDLKDTVFKTNMEAAYEIAKQLRLRDVGGIIIVDFIDMIEEKYEKEVLSALESFLSKDRTKTKILGITNLGLVEITRKKVRQGLESILQVKCPYCEGSGKVLSEYTVLHKIEKEIIKASIHTNIEAMIFQVNSDVYKEIKEDICFLNEVETKYSIKAYILPSLDLHHNDLKIKASGRLSIIENMVNELNQAIY